MLASYVTTNGSIRVTKIDTNVPLSRVFTMTIAHSFSNEAAIRVGAVDDDSGSASYAICSHEAGTATTVHFDFVDPNDLGEILSLEDS